MAAFLQGLQGSLPGGKKPAAPTDKDKPNSAAPAAPAKTVGGAIGKGISKLGSALIGKMKGGGSGGSDMTTGEGAPEMHKGGMVPETRTYKLQKGEKVIAKEDVKKASAGLADRSGQPARKGKLTMTIRPTDNEKYIVQHEHKGGGLADMGKANEEHGIEDIKALHKHIDEHYGSPNGSGVASDWEKAQAGDKEAQPSGEKKAAAGVAPANTKD
jgi:hypothetical protein